MDNIYSPEKHSEKQINVLNYGNKIRYLRGVCATAFNAQRLGALTLEEKGKIDAIIKEAEERAKKDYEAQKSTLDSRTATEQRQYTGK